MKSSASGCLCCCCRHSVWDKDSLIGYGLAFILFRLFDITKPGPVRKAEALPGAAGVIADDVLAGIAAGVIIAAIFFGLMTGGS